MKLVDLGFGLLIHVGIVAGFKLADSHSPFLDSNQSIFLQDELPLLNPPGSKESPPLA